VGLLSNADFGVKMRVARTFGWRDEYPIAVMWVKPFDTICAQSLGLVVILLLTAGCLLDSIPGAALRAILIPPIYKVANAGEKNSPFRRGPRILVLRKT
jgi:hypothetical protein